jgi:hypothetical protein
MRRGFSRNHWRFVQVRLKIDYRESLLFAADLEDKISRPGTRTRYGPQYTGDRAGEIGAAFTYT